jgi:hypothetical protein
MRSPSRSGAALVEPIEPEPAAAPPASLSVHPFAFDPSLAVDVPLVRWPEQAGARSEFERRGVPCVLVVGRADPPPPEWGELEDWVREPLRHREVVVRAVTVARRADTRCRPAVDHHGRATFRERTVVLPFSQRAIVARLVERFGEVVGDDEVACLFGEGLASTHAEAVKTALRRIKDGLAPLGLRVSRVRGAGYLLDRAP